MTFSLASLLEPGHGNATIVSVKQEISEIGKGATCRGITGLVVAVALVALGITLCLTVSVFGLIAAAVSLPLFFLSYNNLMMGSNIQDIALNPQQFIVDAAVNEENAVNKVGKNTFLFGCVVNSTTENILWGSSGRPQRV